MRGKRVLVTGGSAGIGKAIARKIAEAGAKTLIVARDPEKLAATRAEFAALGLEVETYSADIADDGAARRVRRARAQRAWRRRRAHQQRRALDPALDRQFLRSRRTTSNA